MPGVALFKNDLVLFVNPLMQKFIHLQNLLASEFTKDRDVFQRLDFLADRVIAEKSHGRIFLCSQRGKSGSAVTPRRRSLWKGALAHLLRIILGRVENHFPDLG